MSGLSAPDVSMLRTTRHASQLYLAVYIPTAVWTARINGTQSNGDTTITVDGVSQVRAPQANYQVLFGSTAGARDLGEARFKSYSAPTLTVGAHNSTLTDDAYVTILEFIPPTAIHVTINASDVVFEDGNIAFVSDNAAKIPLARIGIPAVVWRNANTGLGTINFFSDSVAIAPAATIASHSWNFRDGTPGTSASAGTTGAPIAVTFPSAGWRYIQYTVTDSNGATHTRFNPVLVDDYASPQYTHSQIELGSIEVDEQGAASVQVTVHTNASAASFPEGAQVIIFSDDYFDDVADNVSLYPHRENIVMVGYIRSGSTRFSALHSVVEFRLDNLAAVVNNIAQIGGGLDSNATPTGWHQIKSLDYNLGAHHLLTHHSTLSQIADCHLDLTTFLKNRIDLTESNVGDNLTTQMATPTAGKFGCSMQGEIWLQPNPQLLALASRSTDYSINLITSDLRDEVSFGDENYEDQVSRIDLKCDKATGDSWYSLAPEFQLEHGNLESVEGYRADSQNAANALSGMLLGSRNNSPKETILRTRGNYRFLQPFPIQPITATFAAATNARGTVWTNQRAWVNRVSLQYTGNGKLLVDVTVEKDSSGPPGITGEYPAKIPDPIYDNGIDPLLDPVDPPPPPPFRKVRGICSMCGRSRD